jgi:hypothetical protein
LRSAAEVRGPWRMGSGRPPHGSARIAGGSDGHQSSQGGVSFGEGLEDEPAGGLVTGQGEVVAVEVGQEGLEGLPSVTVVGKRQMAEWLRIGTGTEG